MRAQVKLNSESAKFTALLLLLLLWSIEYLLLKGRIGICSIYRNLISEKCLTENKGHSDAFKFNCLQAFRCKRNYTKFKISLFRKRCVFKKIFRFVLQRIHKSQSVVVRLYVDIY